VAGEPRYTGPKTGEFDASLGVLAVIADRQAAGKVTLPLQVYTGPWTGEMAAVTVMTAREAAALRSESRQRAARERG